MGCCGMGTCTDPDCWLCTVIAKLPQRRQRKEQAQREKPVKPKDEKPLLKECR